MTTTTSMYYPEPEAVICHYIAAKEKEGGIVASIFRDIGKHPPKENYRCHFRQMERLFDPKFEGPKDVVFLQACPSGRPFQGFEAETQKMVMTLTSYFNLLNFFRHDYDGIKQKMDIEKKRFSDGNGRFNLCNEIYFIGPGGVIIKHLIDTSNGMDLVGNVKYSSKQNKKTFSLTYSEEGMDGMYLPLSTIIKLSETTDKLFYTLYPDKMPFQSKDDSPMRKKARS